MHNALHSGREEGSLRRGAPVAVVAAALWASIAIAKSLPESLWLDELHTAWSASGAWEEVPDRAALGNQLSPYFRLLWVTVRALGPSEAAWRTPSVAAWLIALAVTGWCLTRLAKSLRQPEMLAALALVVCDRMQIFYATEARPYALLSLSNLVAWLALAQWSRTWFPATRDAIQAGDSDVHRLRQLTPRWFRGWRFVCWWFVWCGCNVLSFWLQPTAALAVVAQFVFLLGLAARTTLTVPAKGDGAAGERDRVWPGMSLAGWWSLCPLIAGGIVFTAGVLPAMSLLAPVWEHRQQWAGFAARHRIDDVLGLLPLTAFLTPLLLGVLLSCFRQLPSRRALWHQARSKVGACTVARGAVSDVPSPGISVPWLRQFRRERWMWFCAWFVPCSLVIVMTASGLAPLMHRRYVFVAALPFVLWVAHCLATLAAKRLRWCVLVAMLVLLLHQQGSLSAWQHRRWSTAVRGEDWRGAIGWINSQTSHQSAGAVFCASNLIEGARPISRDPRIRRYLTLPLRSIYELEPPREVIPLGNDPHTWLGAMREANAAGQVLAADGVSAWIVVRSSAAGLDKRLRASGLSVVERRDFGGVQVARVSLATRHGPAAGGD